MHCYHSSYDRYGKEAHMAHAQRTRRRTQRYEPPKPTTSKRRRSDHRIIDVDVTDEPADPGSEFVRNDDWLEPYEPNDDSP